MRIAILYYPMLFQRTGGLQVQVLETAKALRAAGVNAELFDYRKHRLADFDIAHVFSAINGNHRIVEQARSEGLKVVLSTVLHPPWTRYLDSRSTLVSRIAGRLSGWTMTTSHQDTHAALAGSQAIIALGTGERNMLVNAYGIAPEKVHIVPNGIKKAFLNADDQLFRKRFDIQGPYALNVASVSPYKNQLSALRALKGKIPLVVIGPCAQEQYSYLEEMTRLGENWFHYLGTIDNDDPVLPSAYAGASLFVLPSRTEVQPIAALEAMAADCPVIITKNHSLDVLPDRKCLHEVAPEDVEAIKNIATTLLAEPPTAGYYRSQVSQLTWDNCAKQLLSIYTAVLEQ